MSLQGRKRRPAHVNTSGSNMQESLHGASHSRFRPLII